MSSYGVDVEDFGIAGPKSYRISQIIIQNYAGQEADISELVMEMSISESIHSLGIFAEFSVVDGVSFLEEFGISGNEYIRVVFKKEVKDENGERNVIQKSQWFYTIGYPLYSKPKPDTQVYTFQAITATNFLSQVKKTNKVYSGSHAEVVKNLYNEVKTAEVQLIEEDTESTSGSIKYVAPQISYFEAINTILNKTTNDDGSPYYLFESFSDEEEPITIMSSYSKMIEMSGTPVSEGGLLYDTYVHGYFYEAAEVHSAQSFDEQRRRILEIDSNLGFSAYDGIREGGYVARTYEVDSSLKTYREIEYNIYVDEPLKILPDYVIDSEYDVGQVPLEDFKNAKQYYVARNTMAYTSEFEGDEDQSATPLNILSDIIGGKYAGMSPFLRYINQKSTRNQPIAESLAEKIIQAIPNGYRGYIYAGGDPENSETTSKRHNDGGAADLFVLDDSGKLADEETLVQIATAWITGRQGSVGLAPKVGALHLDEIVENSAELPIKWYYGNESKESREAIDKAYEATYGE